MLLTGNEGIPAYAREYLLPRSARMSCPTRWDERLGCHGVVLSADGLEAAVDASRSFLDCWSVVTDTAVDLRQLASNCRGTYYFETAFAEVSSSSSSQIAVGLRFETATMHMSDFAVTYSSEGCYEGAGQLEGLGDTYESGDVVGCGYSTHDRRVFFTRNGIFSGYVSVSSATVCTSARPLVRLAGFNGSVRANFGTQPFLFGITSFVQEQESRHSVLVGALEDVVRKQAPEPAVKVDAPVLYHHALPTPPPSPHTSRKTPAMKIGQTSTYAVPGYFGDGEPVSNSSLRCIPTLPLQEPTPPPSPTSPSHSALYTLRLRITVYWDQRTTRYSLDSRARTPIPQGLHRNAEYVARWSTLR